MNAIKKRREQSDFTQAELAQQTGLSLRTIQYLIEKLNLDIFL